MLGKSGGGMRYVGDDGGRKSGRILSGLDKNEHAKSRVMFKLRGGCARCALEIAGWRSGCCSLVMWFVTCVWPNNVYVDLSYLAE